MAYFPESWMKKDSKEYGGWQIYDYKQSYKISEFLLQSSNKVEKIHYITVNRLMYILGQTNLSYKNSKSFLHV